MVRCLQSSPGPGTRATADAAPGRAAPGCAGQPMQGQRRGAASGPRAAAEPKAPAGRRDLDVNRERLIYCLTSLVGHRATAKLRNNVVYEGIFHSCSLDGDYSITLKSARLLPSGGGKSGEVIRTLVIPGKDFLQVSAVDVPPPVGAQEAPTEGSRAFATDAEIAAGLAEQKGQSSWGERELVAWTPAEGETALEVLGGLGSRGDAAQWDQFQTNERIYGITSTYSEELYTTKLDPASIPREKREEAERIAREIESGRMASEVEGCLDGEGPEDEALEDEELAFSAVGGTGAYRRKELAGGGGAAASSKGRGVGRAATAPLAELPLVPNQGGPGFPMPLTKEHLNQHEALSGVAGDSYAREHRTKRGMITAHSPMRSPMISEMKRINALNLEPALPKLDDKTRNDWINFKQSQTRTTAKSAQGHALKNEFQQSLELIQKREASKQAAAAEAANGESGRRASAASGTAMSSGSKAEVGSELGRFGGAGDAGRSKFAFNPAAKEFSFNPGAASFTPTNAMSGGRDGQAKAASQASSGAVAAATSSNAPAPAAQGSGPQFLPYKANPEMLRRSLHEVLDKLLEKSMTEKPEACTPEWPGATGVSFHEVLGQPNPANPLPPMGAMAGGCQGGGGTAPGWGGPAQVPPGGGPQMMPQGFMVPTGAGGPQSQMGYPQMYGGQGQPQQPGPGQQQQPQSGPQGPQAGQQPQPGPMVFQQGMGQPGLQMPTGGGQGTMGAMPKFGQMVPVMLPAGQFGPQGFVPQQGQMMPPGQMMQQGQMMQPGAFHMQRGGQMGGPGPGHQMGGHDG